VGLDSGEEAVGLVRAFVAEHRLANVEVLQGDARATGLPQAAFDLVHARLLLVTLPQTGADRGGDGRPRPPRRRGRPAGSRTWSPWCATRPWRLGRSCTRRTRTTRAAEVDLYLGRRLPALLRAAGVVDVRVRPLVSVCPKGHPLRSLFPHFVENVRERCSSSCSW
jgi:hypothetical protein